MSNIRSQYDRLEEIKQTINLLQSQVADLQEEITQGATPAADNLEELTISELARRLEGSRTMVYNWLDKGLPRNGEKGRIVWGDVQTWLESADYETRKGL